MNKNKVIEYLNKAHDELYDADQLLGGIRTTKETAECLHQVTAKMNEADKAIEAAVDNLA
jgi:hypothetical protein